MVNRGCRTCTEPTSTSRSQMFTKFGLECKSYVYNKIMTFFPQRDVAKLILRRLQNRKVETTFNVP